jgi:2'-5' RNA ligase superfamily
MANESAIIVPIPEVEPIVGRLRLQYDKAARLGVPAHITLLYPFLAPQAVGDATGVLEKICGSFSAFPFSFVEVRRFPATAYLYPDRSERFTQITQTLMGMWPDCKPYGGAFPDLIPHLTVADQVDTTTLNTVEASLRDHLPIRCVAREVWLLVSDPAGLWSRKACFPLGIPAADQDA